MRSILNDLDKYLTLEELDMLEAGLQGLADKHYKQKKQEFSQNMQRLERQLTACSARKRSFNELYAETRATQQKRSQEHAQHTYEQEQKIAEQEWLKNRERRYSAKGGYEAKLITKPYISSWQKAGA